MKKNFNRRYSNAQIAEVIELYICENMTAKEISEKTGLAPSMCKVSISKYFGVPFLVDHTEILVLQQKESGTE